MNHDATTRNSEPADRLARYAPAAATLDTEWSHRASEAVLTDILATATATATATAPAEAIPLRFVPAQRARLPRRPAVALAASVATLGIGGAALLALLPGGDAPQPHPGGPRPSPTQSRFVPPAGLSDEALPENRYALTISETVDVDASGRADRADTSMAPRGVSRTWTDAKGNVTRYSPDDGGCQQFPNTGQPSFGVPSVAFLERLPTDVDALQAYLDEHVEGSTSRSEAVFVAVEDTLRAGDQLASPKLRAAMLAVLNRTSGVTLHLHTTDFLGRDAIRADFVDTANRGNEVSSLFVDPADFHFLEERSGTTGEAEPSATPSPAYTAQVADAPDPEVLPEPSSLTVNRSESVVDAIPAQYTQNCTVNHS